ARTGRHRPDLRDARRTIARPRLLPRDGSPGRRAVYSAPEHSEARPDPAENPQTSEDGRVVIPLRGRPMRVLFCGTPEIGIPTLRALLADARFLVDGVVTQPDRPRGRGLAPGESAVKQLAREAALDVFQPEKIRSPEAQKWIEGKAPDAAVLIAYGQILPAPLLSIPRLGWINLHASLLPKYRGAAPIAWAIANGETRTGITTMQIDAGMDTGSLLLRKEMEIGPEETAPELSARMAEAGEPLVIETLAGLEAGTLRGQVQDNEQASYAPLLRREDGGIRWEMPARQIYNRMRGFAPWPGTFAEF